MELTLANAGRATAPDPLDIFGEHPWDVAQRQQDEAQAKWWTENRTRADEAFLDPQKAFPDMEQGFADSVDSQRKLAAVDDLMRLHNQGDDPPADDYGRYLMRERIAHLEFDGEGIESDEALFTAGQKYAQKGVDDREFSKKLRAFAADDASLPTGDGPGLAFFMKAAATMPGFDPDKVADYAEEWNQSRAELNERIAPIREPLQHVWRAFRTGVEPGKDILASIPDDQFSDFLNLLRLRAETLGDEEKESFLAGMRKDFGRQVEGYYRQAGESFDDVATGIPGFGFQPGDLTEPGVSPETRELSQTGRNRAHEVRRIFSSTYDPIDYVKGLGWAQKIPGVTVTSMTMAVPGAGTPMMFGSMMGAAQESAYLKARDSGMSEEAAGSYASAIAPAIAIPQSIMEKVGFGILTRRLPAFNALLTKMDDAIVNRGLRFATKTATVGTAETTIEITQDLTETAVTDIASALNSDLPDVDWNTELKGAWNSIPEIFGSMVVLSMFGAAGGLNAEARAAAFQSASDRQLTAAGLTPEAIAAVRSANGPASTVAAVQAAWSTRDPNSPEAKAASEEEASALARARAAGEALRSSGALPSIVVGKDGFTVLDGETKDEVGSAKTMADAWRIAQAHSDFLADLQGDSVAYMATLLESADFVSKLDPDTKTELDLGTVMDRALLEATKPEMAARFALQAAMKEQAAGGTGEISYAINGWSETEIRDNLRQTTNRIFSGASALTVFHEFTHGKRREARAAGRITRGDELSFIRAIDTVLGTRKTKEGERMAFLENGMTDDQVTEEMIDEAMSEIMEMEILRSREGGTKRKQAQRPGVVGVPSGFITRNLKAIGRLAPEATRKFSAFIEAVRSHFGTAMARALALKKAEREGKFDADSYDAFLAKMMGLDLQDDHNARVDKEAARIYTGDPRLSPEAFAALGDPNQEDVGDDIPFSLTPAKLGQRLLDRIGEQALRVEQPKAKYEDKRQLLLDFAQSVLRPEETTEKPAGEGNLLGHTFGPLQVIRQRFAEKLAIDLQIRFVGESLTDLVDLVERAQALRNPLFETFYLIAIKRGEHGDTVQDVQAITSRCPVSAAVTDHANGLLAGIKDQADFLRQSGADEFYLLHNHPSGDPSPSGQDKALTLKYHEVMKAEGFALRGHVVINHRTFQNITVEDTGGGLFDAMSMSGSLEATGKADPYAWPLFSNEIGKQIDSPEKVAELGRQVAAGYAQPDAVIGFITDARHKVVGVLAGKPDEFLGLTNEQLQDYAREQGGSAMMLHAKSANQAEAMHMLSMFATANANHRVMEMVVEYPGGYVSAHETGMYILPKASRNERFFNGEGAQGQRVQEETAFSLAPSRALDLMQMNALDRVRNPRRRAEIFTRMSREFQRLKLAAERLEIVSGTKRLRKSLLKEAAMREAKARDDLESDVYSRMGEVFADEDLVKIKTYPVHAHLSVHRPAHTQTRKKKDGTTYKVEIAAGPDPLRGRLMSRTAAMKHNAELFGEKFKGGDWDGSDGIMRSNFGGTLMPDQAAQELYDAGLIKDPYVDTMWQALRAEQNTVAGMKEQAAKAEEQLREARIAAKEEANAWLKHAAKGQQEMFNPREEILRMVASLEAILRPLPPAVRIKVGGYQQMIRIAGTEGQLKFLREQISKADKELEKWMRETIGKEFRELMEKTKPERDEAGKRPKGKIGADIHDIFRSIDAAIYLDGAETEAEATRLETLADAETTTDEQRAHLMMEANLVRLTGNWAKADSARREAALEAATNAYYGGYMAAQMKAAGRRARNDFRRADLKAATGKTQNPQERADEEVKSLGTKLGRAKQAVFSLFSFDQMMGLVFGTDSETAKLFTEWELRAANAKEDAMQRSHDAVESLLTDLAGGELAGEKLRHKLATERSITWKDHKGRQQTATEMEAISYTLMWRQEDGKRHMEGIIEEQPDGSTTVLSEWHWREEDISALEKQLSKEAKAIRMFLTDSYAAEYDRINAVFSDLYGVNMPRHKDYAPIKVAPSHAAGGQTADPVSGSMTGPGLTPGSLKNRSHSAVAEPARIDALQHYVAHTKQMEHFIAYAAFSTELMAVVNNREVGNTIEAKAGKEAVNVIRGWADYFAQGGTRDAAAHLAASHWFQRGLDRISQMALVGRASVLAIQSVQIGAALYQMPAGSYLKRLAKLSTGQLGWGKAIRSEYIQRRLSQMPPAVQQAMAGLAAGSPSRIKHATAKLGRLISGADALFTAGTYAMIYDYQLTAAKRMNVPNPEAFAEQEAIRLTDQVAQPMRAGARSMMEVTSTNPAFRMMWAFASEPRQKIAMAVHQAMTKKGAGRFRAAGVTWLVSGMAAAILRSAIRDLRDDGEDDEVFDEKNWSPERLILSSLAGPLGGLPLIGKEIESALYAGAGEYMPAGSLIGGPVKAVGTVKKLATGGGEWDDAIKDTETILGGVGAAFPTAAAATSWTHIARDVEGIIKNLTE